ncbi:MAG: BON domain-containing protein [Rhodospirillaceae bacterium]|jgi:osmotically-inducible protein OsmY|nr:BON domain-containing protein [Rhodospirillaceae bacterium]MBT5458092.1 BON domain-containing protein [Rhodospirillaceae bacterium]
MSKRPPCVVSLIVVALAAMLLPGCNSIAVGTGAGAAVASAAAEERGIASVVTDLTITTTINKLWLEHDSDFFTQIDATVKEGRVLLTGIVPTQKKRVDAVRLVWHARGVKSVINEIQVSNAGGIATFARDSWITTQLVSRLSLDLNIKNINYTIETVNSTVYVMGIAQDSAELERVTNHARQVRYVRRVVNHARLKNDPRRKSKAS